jgi:hypothetical protein
MWGIEPLSIEVFGDEGDIGPEGYITEELHVEYVAEAVAEEREHLMCDVLHAIADECKDLQLGETESRAIYHAAKSVFRVAMEKARTK